MLNMKKSEKRVIKKEEITGNELDLSMNQLTSIPVHELIPLTKVTHLDMSSNKIEVVPENFSSLVHLVKLDLSKNSIEGLPHNFGNLVNLQSLDLYGNKIEILPVSFCNLKHLKWLDVSHNRLDPRLAVAAGDCLDEQECNKCAKNVVAFMQTVQSEIERKKQIALKAERERDAIVKAEEERLLAEQRKMKKVEKERKKAESKARMKQKESELLKEPQTTETKQGGSGDTLRQEIPVAPKQGSWLLCMFTIFLAVLGVLFAMIGYQLLDGYEIESFDDMLRALQQTWKEVNELVEVWWNAFVLPYLSSLKHSLGLV